MDTELQNAADQSALAAATQLDGVTGAQARAISAAKNLITNRSRMSIDTVNTTAVTIQDANVVFYSVYNDTTKTVAAGDADSNYVKLTVDSRTANYAFTPIVAAFAGTT